VRICFALLIVVLIALQARLWVSGDGYPAVAALSDTVDEQRMQNEELKTRNARLAAEVSDLREGFAALEERARADLGLIVPGESFYLFAAPEQGAKTPDAAD
jgi:cell division protein FtsB